MTQIISRTDFEAFAELVGAKVVRWPLNNSSKMVVEIKLSESVDLRLNLVAIEEKAQGKFYGRCDEYTHLRVPKVQKGWIDGDYNLSGKGCRSNEVHSQVVELLSLL